MGTQDGAPWPPMLWIGGAQGAGKSRLSWTLAHTRDLPLHPVDLWSYDHAARMPPAASTLDDELARGAQAAANAFVATSRARVGLVLEDVAARGLGPVPALVEGPQLMPSLAKRLPRGWAVWLIPDSARTRLARQERLAREQRLAAGKHPTADHPTADHQDRLARAERLVERDAVLAARIRQAAAQSGLPVIEVPETPDWPAIAAAVEAALTPALRACPRLAPGRELRRQRRRENAAACRQVRLWRQAARLATMPPYPFACECGGSGCQAVWPATPGEYDTSYAERPLVVAEHG